LTLINETNTWKKLLLILLFIYFSTCLVFILYLPFIVPLILLEAFVVIGYLAKNNLKPKKLISIGAFLMPALFLIALFTLGFYSAFHEVIKTISSTDYPGKRVVVGGSYNLVKFFLGFFSPPLQKPSSVPANLGNQSEVSTGLFFFPFLLPLV